MKTINYRNLQNSDLLYLLNTEDQGEINNLFQAAYDAKLHHTGKKVYYRGIIEFSNICTKDCYYCGIRKSNKNLVRFSMAEDEILQAAEIAWKMNYGSLVLQSGERSDEEFVNLIDQLLKKIKKLSNAELGITLSLGEQTAKTYRRWFSSGAHRYLLRIESSDEVLYKKLHPESQKLDIRLNCLDLLKETGYQVGTGVLIGLPGQTGEMLANDLVFFKERDIDMIGMGPYIPHKDTPMAAISQDWDKKRQLEISLKMIALARLFLKDVNIASTTALQAIHPEGRELGLLAGANIIMPNITHTKYREKYRLYDGKPSLDENAAECRNCLETRIINLNEEIGYNQWGDSLHFKRRTQDAKNTPR